MFEKLCRVHYLSVKNTFCYLSHNFVREFGSDAVVKINSTCEKEAFFSVAPTPHNLSDDFIGINALYAKLLGIEEYSTVLLTKVNMLSKVETFTIHPLREGDYDVLSSLKQEVEKCVLHQTKLVNENQKLILWIGDNLNISVDVVSVSPVKFGYLDNLTELVIIPTIQKMDNQELIGLKSNMQNTEEKQLKQKEIEIFNISHNLTANEIKHKQKIASYSSTKGYINGRLVSFDCLREFAISEYFSEFNVFILGLSSTYDMLESSRDPIFCCLRVINNLLDTAQIFVRVFFIADSILQDDVSTENIFVHANLFSILNCEMGTRVFLKPVNKKFINKIIINTEEDKSNAIQLCKEYLANMVKLQKDFIMNADIPMKLSDNVYSTLQFYPKSEYCCINEDFLRNCVYEVRENQSIEKFREKDYVQPNDFIGLASHQKICDDVLKGLLSSMGSNVTYDVNHVLIEGNIGSGKSSIIDRIRSLSANYPYFLYSEVIKSKKLKGKTLDSLHKIFITTFENLISHQPSILFIDDLHVLCEDISVDEALGQNALYFDRISEMLYTLVLSATSSHKICILATTDAVKKLNKNIYSTRGRYLFGEIYHIEELTKEDRKIILRTYLKDNVAEINLEEISEKTEGYAFQDLFDLVKKTVFQFMKDDSSSLIMEKHFEYAISHMKLISLADIKLLSPGYNDFSNIGGLKDIKNQLHEILLWPLRYPKLFDNAPLRLQSGLLFYGHPGTGKTILAAATAKEFDLRLISIKGPELLSKYIGASEQAVRDVFIQAHNARPCILFFDEFDSLAPRRGHDITGVTDRVVNQLLTQMDGVESLSGVCVMAATSRPDLLDPALLRPGRLDKQILCPLPDEQSRLEILLVLSKSLKLSDDVNLEEFAKKTDGFSGADLQSFLYNAQLSGMERLFEPENNGGEQKELIITYNLLNTSLSNTRPSLTKQEKEKYNFIYSKFQGKTDLKFSKPGTRASMA